MLCWRRHETLFPVIAWSVLAAGVLCRCASEQNTIPDQTNPIGGENEEGVWVWTLPEGFPEPRIPEDNPMSMAKVELGRHLFYDTVLSGNQTQSCASCHNPAKAFSDGRALSPGSTGEETHRSSPSLTNVAYAATLHWANPLLRNLEEQVLLPLFSEDPIELGLVGREDEMLDRLRNDMEYPKRFIDAFGNKDGDPISLANITKAIASFERVLISGGSPYDRYIAGDSDAISASAKRGLEEFFSEGSECFHCHGGFNFTQSVDHEGLVFDQALFSNTGLYNLGSEGDYPENNQGLFDFTGNSFDKGKFRPPTLRNIDVTSPYVHDGSIATLEDIIDHYDAGGRNVASGLLEGDGRENPNKSSFVREGTESEDDNDIGTVKDDLLAFLRSLTDEEFLTRPAIQNPFGSED